MIFQDPYASLNPRMTVKRIISEPLTAHNICPTSEYEERVAESLRMVGLEPAHMGKYPHEFSGGQRQRIGIARAMITQPDFVICDEPISALDVSIQAQVVNMLQSLQEQLGLTYCFIAHDLAMVKYISKRIGVMYVGQLVEVSPSEELYRTPLHPYTIGLMRAIPVADPRFRLKARSQAQPIHLPDAASGRAAQKSWISVKRSALCSKRSHQTTLFLVICFDGHKDMHELKILEDWKGGIYKY
jgi:ABC-type oligopeptide transport system ATPase subunit